ncbi:hypothetical protein D3C78_1721150 [compost metagenome]
MLVSLATSFTAPRDCGRVGMTLPGACSGVQPVKLKALSKLKFVASSLPAVVRAIAVSLCEPAGTAVAPSGFGSVLGFQL